MTLGGTRRATLRARLLALLGIVTLPALVMILLTAAEQRRLTTQAIESDALRLARLASREHAREITGGRELLSSLGRIPGAAQDVAGHCPAFFQPLLRGFPHLANLGILTKDGAVSCSVAPLPNPVDMSQTPAFERAVRSQDVEIGDYQIGLIVHRPVLVLAYAVRGAAGEVARVLFVALELGWFGQLAEQAELPRETVLALVDRQGRILASSVDSARWVGAIDPALAPLLDSAPTGRRIGSAVSIDGVHRLLAVAALAGVEGVHVLVGVPSKVAFEPADRALRQQIAALVALALFAAAVGLLGTEVFVLRGIRALVLATRRLELGDTESRAPERLPEGEIADLAAAFNSMADVLERRQREAEGHAEQLRASERQLRALSQGLQSAREEERTRISRELHDQLGQSLTALKLELAALGRAPGRAGAEGTTLDASRLAEITNHVDGLVQLVRDISTALRPGVLDQLGLQAALEWQAAEFERQSGIHCTLDIGGALASVAPEVSTAVFRVFQEALTNVARHSGAREVRVSLEGTETALTLEVVDDGAGLPDGAATSPTSLGLLGMRERVRLINGTLILGGAPGRGTSVKVVVPIGADRGGETC